MHRKTPLAKAELFEFSKGASSSLLSARCRIVQYSTEIHYSTYSEDEKGNPTPISQEETTSVLLTFAPLRLDIAKEEEEDFK